MAQTLGDPVDTGDALLTHAAPTAERIVHAGPAELIALGIPRVAAQTIGQVARMIVNGSLRLVPGGHVDATQRALLEVDGMTGAVATAIVSRALQWPDAFAPSDRSLRRVMGASSIRDVAASAERWRPWRAYAAMHLLLRVGRTEGAERMAHA